LINKHIIKFVFFFFLISCFLAGLVILLTFPVLYEKFEDNIDRFVILTLVKLHMYESIYAECFSKAKEWILEKMKESWYCCECLHGYGRATDFR